MSYYYYYFCLALKLIVSTKYSEEEGTQKDLKVICACMCVCMGVDAHVCMCVCSLCPGAEFKISCLCYDLNVFHLQNLGWNLVAIVTAVSGRIFKRWLGHACSTLMNGLMQLSWDWIHYKSKSLGHLFSFPHSILLFLHRKTQQQGTI